MNAWNTLLRAWDWEPSIIVGCAALLAGYFIVCRGKLTIRSGFFIGGVIVLFLSLVSPLDVLADDYLFSAHMFQHLILSQIVPPLLLLGMPVEFWRRILRWKTLHAIERILRQPLLAWICGIGTLWLWHWPPLFEAALRNENLHILQHLCFLVTGCIFWWPVVSPLSGHHMSTFPTVFYLFTACTASSLLGICITFAERQLYPFYLNPEDSLGLLHALRARLSVHQDQTLGGLLMWFPCCLIYLSAVLITIGRWYGGTVKEDSSGIYAAHTST